MPPHSGDFILYFWDLVRFFFPLTKLLKFFPSHLFHVFTAEKKPKEKLCNGKYTPLPTSNDMVVIPVLLLAKMQTSSWPSLWFIPTYDCLARNRSWCCSRTWVNVGFISWNSSQLWHLLVLKNGHCICKINWYKMRDCSTLLLGSLKIDKQL